MKIPVFVCGRLVGITLAQCGHVGVKYRAGYIYSPERAGVLCCETTVS